MQERFVLFAELNAQVRLKYAEIAQTGNIAVDVR